MSSKQVHTQVIQHEVVERKKRCQINLLSCIGLIVTDQHNWLFDKGDHSSLDPNFNIKTCISICCKSNYLCGVNVDRDTKMSHSNFILFLKVIFSE